MSHNRFCAAFGVPIPVVLAPMGMVSGGELAGAVSSAGGLGLIGGGYGDHNWLSQQLGCTSGQRVGCGFITWSLRRDPTLLDAALAAGCDPIMLSFGEAGDLVAAIRGAGRKVMLQVHSADGARAALDLDIDALIAQGAGAGGHGTGARSEITLIPEVADLVAERRPGLPLLAAGGIADGRGLAAALTLGADGALVGTRLWASREALVAEAAHKQVTAARGDDTVRSAVFDILRGYDWPAGYRMRTLSNDTVSRWHGNEDALRATLPQAQQAYQRAVSDGDFTRAAVIVGECVGLIADAPPAAEIVARMAGEAADILATARKLL